MKYLLDTHAWVWWNMTPEKLSRKARAAIENADHYSEILVSAIDQLIRDYPHARTVW